MADIEGSFDAAAVRIDEILPKELLIDVNVVDVDGTVKGEGDHLRHLTDLKVSGYLGAVGGAKAVRDDAPGDRKRDQSNVSFEPSPLHFY